MAKHNTIWRTHISAITSVLLCCLSSATERPQTICRNHTDDNSPSDLEEPSSMSLLVVSTVVTPTTVDLDRDGTKPVFPSRISPLKMFWDRLALGERALPPVSISLLVVPILLGFAFLLLIGFSFIEFSGSKPSSSQGARSGTSAPGEPADEEFEEVDTDRGSSGTSNELQPWSTLGIVALTSYRFYTGFLSATWMPYLLAMEGQRLMADRQSLFMGSAKLIYGLSILLNPVFGLVGDQVASYSHWSGRRLFILVGVAASGLGIYGCLVSAQIHSISWYLVATVLWMLGEAMADVTTETLVPELLPRSQYEISSSIRAMNFLLGGLSGYGMLIIFRHASYSWLYYAYLILMVCCATLSLGLINTRSSKPRRISSMRDKPFSLLLLQAYLSPTYVQGGFPRACLCLFVFSLGSAPMFFLLLMVRDVVRVQDATLLQTHFSIISIVFFVCAALASLVGAWFSCSADEGAAANTRNRTPPPSGQLTKRWQLMIASTILFGLICFLIPVAGVFQTLGLRLSIFYVLASLFGFSFGSVYARFQDCTWSLLPVGTDIANLMGFAAMSKLAGVGIGNFIAGIILDYHQGSVRDTYELKGYVMMCTFCAVVVFISAALAWSVGRTACANDANVDSQASVG